MGILSRAVGALFGISDSAEYGGYEENSDRVDYGNGDEAALHLHYQQQEDGESETYTHSLHAGRMPHKTHQITVEHTGIENFGDADLYELASEYEARNAEAFADGFADRREYYGKPGLFRSIFGFFENNNL